MTTEESNLPIPRNRLVDMVAAQMLPTLRM